MKLCDDGHDEVAYDDARNCPACELANELKDKTKDIKLLEDTVSERDAQATKIGGIG